MDQTRLVLERSPDAFVAAGPGRRIIDWNAKATELLGWSQDEALGRPLQETLPLDPDACGTVEVVAVHKDGHRVAVEAAIAKLDDGSIYAFIRDITHRRAIQEGLRARERQLSEALTLANLGSWSWDVGTNVVTWSDELYAIFDIDRGSPVDFDAYLDRAHPEDREMIEATIREAMRESQTFEFDHRIVRGDGSIRWLHCLGEVIVGDFGPERLYGTTEDVTDDKLAERTRSLLAAIVESTDDAIKSMATDGTIISWNAAAEQLYGYEADEILGRPVLELFPPEGVDAVLAVFKSVVEDGRVERCELKQVRKDGTRIDVGATLSPIRVGGRIVGVSAVSRNITARKRAQEALQSALEREQKMVRDLQDLDRIRSDFISDVSHELRTPLTSISGYTELLSGGSFGDINEPQETALDVIARNTRRLLDLIEDIMALSRMESGVFSLHVEPTDLAALITGAGDAMASAAEAKGVDFVVDIDGDLGFGSVDPSQLDRALLNVLSNAVKFTPSGGHVRLHARRLAGDVVITVTDDGIGIDEHDQQQVFKRFFRSSLATRSAIQGTGLGLVITKTIIDHHHGSIRLQSEPGKGTTVHMRIPADTQSAVAV